MALEIERKFLVVSNDFKNEASEHYKIIQGFLNSDPMRTVRVRLQKDQGLLTVKGKSTDDGLVRFEWETEISVQDAKSLLQLCEKGIIDKTRYQITYGTHVFEVDVFHGENDGLILAEIELRSVNDIFEKPNWLGKEVTGDIKYYNSNLSKNPYKNWSLKKPR